MELFDLLETTPDAIIADAFVILHSKLQRYKNIVCSISGGADSDIVLDMCTKLDPDKKIKYVFFDTGLESKATKKHLDYLEQKYNIKIERQKAIKPIPTCCREYGVPFLSKHVSEMISRLQRHNFKWEDKPFDELIKEYPHCKSALEWWCNKKIRRDGKIGSLNIARDKYLKEFMIENPPDFPISNKCCTYAKKEVAKRYYKEVDADLSMIGIRKAEGGVRSVTYKSCFTPGEQRDEFRPVFWFTNQTKIKYEDVYEVIHSDCYKVYGFTRTGCMGCPYNHNVISELSVLEEHEPLLYKATQKVFGKSYEYTRKYREYKQKRLSE